MRREQNKLEGGLQNRELSFNLSKGSIINGTMDSGVERSEPFDTPFNCNDEKFHPESVLIKVSFNPYLKRIYHDSDRSIIYKRAHTNSFLAKNMHLPIIGSPSIKQEKEKLAFNLVASHLPRIDLPPGIVTQVELPTFYKSLSVPSVQIKPQSLQDKYIIKSQELKIAHLRKLLESQKSYYNSEIARFKVPYIQAYHEGREAEKLAQEKRRISLVSPSLNPLITRIPNKTMHTPQSFPCNPGSAPDTNAVHNMKRRAAKLVKRSKATLAPSYIFPRQIMRPQKIRRYAKQDRKQGNKFAFSFSMPKPVIVSPNNSFPASPLSTIFSPCPSPLFKSVEEIEKDISDFAQQFEIESVEEHVHNLALVEVPEVEPFAPTHASSPDIIFDSIYNPALDMDMD
jgi:hypothetical protein